MPLFQAISMSGRNCQLHCKHCDATYLGGMLQAETPEKLYELCVQLEKKGVIGILLSGGSDKNGGILNLEWMLPAIQQIRHDTSLIVNIHPGLVSEHIAKNLSVDFASIEIPSDETIHDVFGLGKNKNDYIETYHILKDAGIHVVPHVSVYNGNEHYLIENIDPPETVVVIVFSPTKNTPMDDKPSPTPDMVENVVRGVKTMYSHAEVSLGCMRSRDKKVRVPIELAALRGGATRMELPSRQAIEQSKAFGFTSVVNFHTCCALPKDLENRVRIQQKRLMAS